MDTFANPQESYREDIEVLLSNQTNRYTRELLHYIRGMRDPVPFSQLENHFEPRKTSRLNTAVQLLIKNNLVQVSFDNPRCPQYTYNEQNRYEPVVKDILYNDTPSESATA